MKRLGRQKQHSRTAGSGLLFFANGEQKHATTGYAARPGGLYTWGTLRLRTDSYAFTASILIVSYNTRELLRRCLLAAEQECARLPEGESAEIVVVDNASADGSAAMVREEFAGRVRLLEAGVNLGFGAANNVAIEAAAGEFLVLLNSDAFFQKGALARAIAHMREAARVGAGGARLVSADGTPQPSARSFPTLVEEARTLLGRAGAQSPESAATVDWVTGAFMILRRQALAQSGLFDERFFLFCEEVDLCRRIGQAGYAVQYWPDVVVTHLGGESSGGAQVFRPRIELWQLRSTLLYFRKHHGAQVWLLCCLYALFFLLRWGRNSLSSASWRRQCAGEAEERFALLRQAWSETAGGRTSPPRPW